MFPAVLAASAVFALLAGTVVLIGSRMLYRDQAAGRISVAVVMEEEDPAGEMALSMLSGMDSVSSICDFIRTSEDEAREGVRQGSFDAALLIPPQLVQGIMDGSNPPVQVLLKNEGGPEPLLLQELTESGARILGASQAGIYAADFYCREAGMEEIIPQTEDFLNRVYMDYAFQRSGWFGRVTVSALGEMDLTAYYGTSAVVLLMLLTGIPCACFLERDSDAVAVCLQARGIGRPVQLFTKLMVTTGLMLLTAVCLGGAASALLGIWTGKGIAVTAAGLPGWAAAALICGAAAVFSFEAAGSLLTGSMLLFVLSAAMVLLSGGLLPQAFLPEALRSWAAWIPVDAARRMLGGLFGYPCSAGDVLRGTAGLGLFYVLALAGGRSRK